MFSISNIGMSYPGLNTKSKVHLYKTICLPTLLYGVDCLSVSVNNVPKIHSGQGYIMKYVCGLSKRSHHSNFLQALGITGANTILNEYNKSLFTQFLRILINLHTLMMVSSTHYELRLTMIII